MVKEHIIELNIDLVFKFESLRLKNISCNQNDNLIFEHYFWKEIFAVWINVILSENEFSNLSNLKLKNPNFSLSFEIIDDELIADLNKKWLNKNGPTDVLSFPIISENDLYNQIPCIELGDLFISIETAQRQAIKYNNSLQEEMIWLASHGFLHLLGWDHHDKNELDKMLNFQEFLISKLNKIQKI
tara:strand:+ start:290 stop:847 length:558 start_codon:yes stop_codon:yes gene_type:complete